MKTLASLLFILLFLNSCHPINKDVERYNKEKHKKLGEYLGGSIYYMRGDTGVKQMGLTRRGGYYEEYPPGPSYYMIRKDFYPNGVLESKGMYAGERTPIGMWYYYDDRGNLIEEIDADARFGKIKLDWIIEFLKKEGYDNWKRNDPFSLFLRLNFFGEGECVDVGEEYNDYPVWFVSVYKMGMIYSYHIHGDTGEIMRKKSLENPSYKD